jgi:hypothetical protein
MTAMESGIRKAAPKPRTARAPIRAAEEGANALPREASPKSPRAIRRSLFLPKRSPRRPAGRSIAANTRLYATTNH